MKKILTIIIIIVMSFNSAAYSVIASGMPEGHEAKQSQSSHLRPASIALQGAKPFPEQNIKVLDFLDPALFSQDEIEIIQERAEILKKVFPSLSPEARNMLFRPDMLAVFLGVKPAFIRSEEDANLNIKILADEVSRFPEVMQSFGLMFSYDHIISVSNFIDRLKKQARFLVKKGAITARELKFLTSREVDRETIRMIQNIFNRSRGNTLDELRICGFAMGYSIDDIEYAAEYAKDPTAHRIMNIVKNRYGLMLLSDNSSHANSLLLRWESVLNYAYGLLNVTPTADAKSFPEPESRKHALEKHIRERTGKEIFNVSSDSADKIVEVFKRGEVVSLDFSDLILIGLKRRFLVKCCSLIANKFLNKEDFSTGFYTCVTPIIEIIKNAFAHGNKLDTSYPIYVYINVDNDKQEVTLEVYDFALEQETADEQVEEARESDFFGLGNGEKILSESGEYKRSLILDSEGKTIGTLARFAFDPSVLDFPIEQQPNTKSFPGQRKPEQSTDVSVAESSLENERVRTSFDVMPWKFTKDEIPENIKKVVIVMLSALENDFRGIVLKKFDGSSITITVDKQASEQDWDQVIEVLRQELDEYPDDKEFSFLWFSNINFSALGIVSADIDLDKLSFDSGPNPPSLSGPETKSFPEIEFVKEEGRWHAEAGKEKWHEIHCNGNIRGWIFYHIEDGELKVTAISISTKAPGWEDVYKAALLKLRDIAIEQDIQSIHFEKISNDIFLKYMLEIFHIKRKIHEILDGREFTVVGYDEEEKRAFNYFSPAPNFKVRSELEGIQATPSKLKKVETPGFVDSYSVVYNEAKSRFELILDENGKAIQGIDFQIGGGYLQSDLELSCAVPETAKSFPESSKDYRDMLHKISSHLTWLQGLQGTLQQKQPAGVLIPEHQSAQESGTALSPKAIAAFGSAA